jgi:hypothetical protein
MYTDPYSEDLEEGDNLEGLDIDGRLEINLKVF